MHTQINHQGYQQIQFTHTRNLGVFLFGNSLYRGNGDAGWLLHQAPGKTCFLFQSRVTCIS
jgi:hypothetical protein